MKSMDDRMIDRYITEQIRKRGITLYDIIGEEYIDPDPHNVDGQASQRARWNRFKTLSGDLRFCELLTEGDFDEYNPYRGLAIPVKDLVRYWWDNIVDHDLVLGEIFGDIMDFYKDKMLPEEQEEELDLSDSFDELLEMV